MLLWKAGTKLQWNLLDLHRRFYRIIVVLEFGRKKFMASLIIQCMSTTCKTRKELDKFISLYVLDFFSLNTTLDHNLNPANYSSNRITSRYFSPHSFKEMKTKLSKDETISSFSVFHNNVVSLNCNLENLHTQLLHKRQNSRFFSQNQ